MVALKKDLDVSQALRVELLIIISRPSRDAPLHVFLEGHSCLEPILGIDIYDLGLVLQCIFGSDRQLALNCLR